MFGEVVIVFLAYLQFATPIRCYDCTSANNSMCLDPNLYDKESVEKFLPSLECGRGLQAIVPDDASDFFCRKIVQKIFHKHYEPEVRITRSCGWKRSNRDCYKADNEDHLETVCQCFTDGCNSSTRHAIGWSMIALVLLYCAL